MIAPKVSIIIPVYNSEKYLNECLDSIKNQTFSNFEVLMVNDGSEDNSGLICDDYSKEDSRFHVLYQKNDGVSSARNNGLNHSKGEWILFVDSDDWLEPDYVCEYVKAIKKNVDLIYGGYTPFGAIRGGLKGCRYDNCIYSDNNISHSLRFCLAYCTPWGKLYRKSIITANRLSFEERLTMSEDRLFLYQFLSNATGVSFISYCGYHYRVLSTSLMNKKHPNEEYLLRMSTIWDAALSIREKWNLSLKDFTPLYVIHCGYIMELFKLIPTIGERKILYTKYIKAFFPIEYQNSVKEEKVAIKSVLGDIKYGFSIRGFWIAQCLLFHLEIKKKVRSVIKKLLIENEKL